MSDASFDDVSFIRFVSPIQVANKNSHWEEEPEKNLMYAIIEDALNLVVLIETNPLETKIALRWIFSDDTWLFSFLNICAVLDIDAEAMRERVRKAQQSIISKNRARSR